MQHTTLADSRTTRGTADGGYLLERQFALLHCERMRLNAVANLYNFVQYPPLAA